MVGEVDGTEWECGGGEVDDPGVQSGNVVG